MPFGLMIRFRMNMLPRELDVAAARAKDAFHAPL